jgi:hypothetical protein
MWRTYLALAKRLSQLCVSVTVLAWFSSAVAQAQKYTITDLGTWAALRQLLMVKSRTAMRWDSRIQPERVATYRRSGTHTPAE